jgi:hypothetical protein
MTKQTNVRPVHYYDTQRHHIACQSPDADDHSTKHHRGVTCTECLALLRPPAAGDSAAASGA